MPLFPLLVNTGTIERVGISETPTLAFEGTLAPYLPRIVLEWLRDAPDARHRTLEGTMAFADISGFTAMSERLAPKGRLGAEEVTDVMSATFAQLLAIVYDNGGGLLKFGGDALLLFFAGEEHARRACASAWGMRDRLRAIGPLPTSVGPAELQMHVGIHTGTFDFFLAGALHRELIVGGPDAVHTVEMEETSEAGEILVSANVARLIDESDRGTAKGNGVLLAAAPSVALVGVPPVPQPDALDLLSCIPDVLRDHLQAGKLDSEHRRATVAFVRFSGALDEHGVTEVVDVLQSACAAHGVCFLESDIDAAGGRIVLVAGVPTTGGEDEERMLRTVRAAIDAETRLPLHIGVASGNVFAGVIGPRYRRSFTILGGTAALAARLMAKAGAREVWTTPDLLERSKAVFETTPVGALVLKGKAEPVEAVSVGNVTDQQDTPTRTRRLPLVDRQRELPVLEASLVPVKMGFGSFVELVGDAGIGKSRIVEELCERAGGLPVFVAACEQYEATTAYFPFRRLLRELLEVELTGDAAANTRTLFERLGAIDAELTPWVPLVADVIDVPAQSTPEADDLQPAFRRARLNGVVETLLAGMIDSPTLLLFEDAHWMDEASSDLLRHLGTRVSSKPWLICSTRRPTAGGFSAAEGTPPVPALSLRLDPIPEEDAQSLAASAAGDDLPAAQIAAIIERAGGNPLFVQELVAATREADHDVAALPESVEGVVTTRIDSLAPGDRALLRWASVLGASFSSELIGRVLEGDPDAALDSESWDRLGEFVERDPYVAGNFHFRHALIRDAAYEGLSFRRRRELHARVGDVLRETVGEDDPETLSLHFSRGERPGDAWIYALVAAENAKAKFANADAIELLRRALDSAKSLPELARADVGRAWESLGDLLELQGDYDEAERAYRSARELLIDAIAQADLCVKEGRLREAEGKYKEAFRWYERGLKLIDGNTAAATQRLRLELGCASVKFRQGALAECADWCARVVDGARAAGLLPELAHAYYVLYVAYTTLGDPRRRDVRNRALPIYEELGDLLGQANALNNLGIDAYYEGRWDEALDFYERSRHTRERIGDIVGAATMANNIAEILSDQGQIPEAESLLRKVVETADATGHALLGAVAKGNLGRAASREGRLDEAVDLLETACAALEAIDAGGFVVEMRARLAETAVFAHDPDRALAVGDVTSETPSVQALIHRTRGYALLQLAQHDRAYEEIERSLAIAREAGALYEVALSLRARALARASPGDRTESDGLLEVLNVVRVPNVPL
jgi:class 3 adenylate cyclase/tetratricopeptide (TPR) repeat protein